MGSAAARAVSSSLASRTPAVICSDSFSHAASFRRRVRFVATSGRTFDGFSGVVAVTGVVGINLDRNSASAVFSLGDGCGMHLPATAPAGGELPALLGDGGGFRNGSVKCLAEQRAHESNPR